ncbi:phosphatidylinositol 3-kinase regulatory subunit alpha-like [Plakobranchus ocellatus]|uniref:Phosphatidylinositol 3-kinase regulatory subunit alpha-like n=1 Tax=Plakobranchus ocellatus TaxID=259542 RepID=A0AAV3YZE1_9GAST|nr:phosphatidylinositol 3-kinase regulatory subunit alpha-like [Plakobranchus ocellatus]
MLSASGDLYYYECLTNYNPLDHGHGRGHIHIEPGDTLEVYASGLKTVKGGPENPQGWVHGRNVTKGVKGLFPGVPYIQLTKKNFDDSGYQGHVTLFLVTIMAAWAVDESFLQVTDQPKKRPKLGSTKEIKKLEALSSHQTGEDYTYALDFIVFKLRLQKEIVFCLQKLQHHLDASFLAKCPVTSRPLRENQIAKKSPPFIKFRETWNGPFIDCVTVITKRAKKQPTPNALKIV